MPSKEALKFMADWVAAIADNVKNPIASINAVLDHAETNIHDLELVGISIAQIRKRLAHLNEYVSELADFALPASLLISKIDIKDLLAQALKAASLPLSCKLETITPVDFPLSVDVNKIELVLKALLRNSVEAIGAHGQARLILRTELNSAGNCVIFLDDNGPGMPDGIAEQAIEPFFTTKEAGTGLGLAIAKKYIEAHGGTMTIGSSPALGGCRITLTLPRAAPANERRV